VLSAEWTPAWGLRSGLLDRVRVWEVAGWAAVLGVAAILRLASLANGPLAPDEAQPALAAWRMWLQNAPPDVGPGVLLIHALAASFGLFGASDFVARLPTAMAGLALVAAPLLLRPLLGPVATLAAGALLALSPMLVFGSRHVDPAILVPTLLALLVGVCARALLAAPAVDGSDDGWEQGATPSPQPSPKGRGSDALASGAAGYHERRADPSESQTAWRWWAYAVPVLLALLLTAGSVAVPALLAVVGAALITWWPAKERGLGARGQEPGGAEDARAAARLAAAGSAASDRVRGGLARGAVDESAARARLPKTQDAGGETARGGLPRPAEWLAAVPLRELDPRLAGVLFVATLVLVGTAGLMDLRGLQGALVDPWVSWLAPYYPRATPIPWLPTLLVYDLPIVVAAIAGIVVVVRRTRPFEHFLLWWTTLAALPLVFQPPDPLPYLLCWLLPLALLGGLALARLAAPGWTWRAVGEDALLAALAGITFVCAVNTVRLLQSSLAAPGGLSARGRELALGVLVLAFLALLHRRLSDWWQASGPPGEASRPLRVTAIIAVALGLAFVGVTNGRLQFADFGAGEAELLRPQALSPSVYSLVEEVQTWARQEPTSPIVVSDALQPLLLWHLRDVPTVRFQDTFPDALSTPPGTVRRGLWPAGPGAPEGERQPLDETITVGPIPSSSALWNWWVYRNSWLIPTRHDIIVVR